MNNVIKLPEPEKRHKQVVSVQEMYCQGNDVPVQMVWDMCRYTRPNFQFCKECPRYEEDNTYGWVQRGCFGAAMEACRYAMAWIERIEHKGPYD